MSEVINGLELLFMDIFTFLAAVAGCVGIGRLWEQRILRRRQAAEDDATK